MSTRTVSRPASLTAPRTRTSSSSEVDARFRALVRSAVPAQRRASLGDFTNVFDLDYGMRQAEQAEQAELADRVGRIGQADGPRWFGSEAAADGVGAVPAVGRLHPASSERAATVLPRAATGRRVRLTRRGRVVAVLVFLAVVLALMTTLGGWATATLTGGTPTPVRVVEVQPGQTLYDIAGSVAKPGHVREMVYRIEELNSLSGATIEEGQKLAVPRG